MNVDANPYDTLMASIFKLPQALIGDRWVGMLRRSGFGNYFLHDFETGYVDKGHCE